MPWPAELASVSAILVRAVPTPWRLASGIVPTE